MSCLYLPALSCWSYRHKFSAGVKGLHSAERERRTQRIGLLPPPAMQTRTPPRLFTWRRLEVTAGKARARERPELPRPKPAIL